MFDYRVGLEEEFFVIDARTRNVRERMPTKFFQACKRHLRDQVTNELLQSQIEVLTSPCRTMGEGRQELWRLRRVLAEQAARHGLGIVAAATHPLAVWRGQKPTRKNRYSKVLEDVQMVGFRNMLCGMHVHVEVPDPLRRVEIMYRTLPHLHLFLALSTSSPFWQGHATGLSGYRFAANEQMPRSGLPELFKSTAEYDAYIRALTEAAVIGDASFVWWAIRPSLSQPTLELRIADVCTRIEDALCLAALYRCLIRRLAHDPSLNADIDVIDRAIAQENVWRAHRYGTAASFVVREREPNSAQPVKTVLDDFLALLREDAEALDCVHEVCAARDILARGSSADTQLELYRAARNAGRSRTQAMREVIDWLRRTTAES
jgi:glutamate---cysteine ligase / carboxylate-amine ligase